VDSVKEPSHAFIVRIWLEHRDIEDAEPIWRGEIEDLQAVRSKEKKTVYFDNLEQLPIYFAQQLQKIGIKINDHETSARCR